MIEEILDISKFNNILVVGLGFRTGLSAANFLAARGKSVTVSDTKEMDQLQEICSQLDRSVRVLTGQQDPAILDAGYDLIVLSPGVPMRIPLIQEAIRSNIPVISEIELASYFIDGYIIAVTGTDGKSTTTALTAHVLKQLGIRSFMGGNIGIPLISLVDDTDSNSVTVVELSSYQLESIKTFRPHVAAVLNITPDHLDRYDTMDDYADAKFNIARNQRGDDYFIYNLDDTRLAEKRKNVKSSVLSFSMENTAADIFIEQDMAVLHENGDRLDAFDPKELFIVGKHNVQNAMAACLMVRSIVKKMNIAIEQQQIAQALCSFKGLEHRMEIVGEYLGRTFINDSKATTVNALEMAVNSLDGNVVLILGGQTKGDNYSRLAGSLEGKVRSIVLIGESRNEFSEIFKSFDTVTADSMHGAVTAAFEKSQKGDTILLSPACASFDMYTSFEERGRDFKNVYLTLANGEIAWT